jgi:hypothetical protein
MPKAPLMKHALRLLLPLLAALLLGACATPAAVSPYVGTYRAVGGGTTLQVRVAADGRVEFFSPADGARASGQAAFGNAGGRSGFTGLLPGGEVFGFSGEGASTSLWIGAQTFTLSALPPQQFGVAAPAPALPAVASTAGGGVASGGLAGLRLSMAKGGNGYFTERSYDFCSDGRVFTRWAESQLSQMGSGVSERTDQGTWRMSGNTLQLNLARGGSSSFTVQRPEQRVVRLDGTSYAAEPAARCR